MRFMFYVQLSHRSELLADLYTFLHGKGQNIMKDSKKNVCDNY